MAEKDNQTDVELRTDTLRTAHFEVSIGGALLRADVSVTPAHVMATGALVSGILLSSAALVWASTSVARLKAKSAARR